MNRADFIVLIPSLTWQNVLGSGNLDQFIWAGRLNSTFSGTTPGTTRIFCAWTRRSNFLCPNGFMGELRKIGGGIGSNRSDFYFANRNKKLVWSILWTRTQKHSLIRVRITRKAFSKMSEVQYSPKNLANVDVTGHFQALTWPMSLVEQSSILWKKERWFTMFGLQLPWKLTQSKTDVLKWLLHLMRFSVLVEFLSFL